MPLIIIVILNVLSIERLNMRLRRFSAVKLKNKQDNNNIRSITDEANVTVEHPSQHIDKKHLCFINKCVERTQKQQRRRHLIRKDPYSKRNRKAVSCILALTCSILITQSMYLVCWPMFDYTKNERNHPMLKTFYIVGVWLSYLTAIFNPLLMCVFNVKVRSYSKVIFQSIFYSVFKSVD